MAKKSRRTRRQESQKQPKPTVPEQPAPVKESSAPAESEISQQNNRQAFNFAQEYFYVYYDMRNVAIISIVMFVVLIGLSFAI